jgi:hypothetical protein
LDQVLRGKVPFLIKVDVEGYESAVFAGAKQMLRQPGLQAMIVERTGIGTRYQFDELALHRTIQAEGFVPCRYSPMERTLERIAPEAEGNIIYVRDFAFIEQRLREAKPFQFGGTAI